MQMKTILNEWRVFLKENKFKKTPLEEEIEAVFAQQELKTGEGLANVKAAAHAIQFLRGQELANQDSYLNRKEYGLTNAQRIIKILRDSNLFSELFDVYTVVQPPIDKRFPETSEKTFKAVEMVDVWSVNNLERQLNPSVRAQGENEESAFEKLFSKIGELEMLLKDGNYEFLKHFGKVSRWRTLQDPHTGGAAATGLIVTPEEATEADKEYIGERFTFYMKHRNSPAYPMTKLAEEKFQEALKKALSLWRKYPFKDGEEKQAFAGAVIRMEQALIQSEKDLQRIMADPEGYSKHNKPAPKEEEVESLIAKAKDGDKEAAKKAFDILRKKGDKRSREMRRLMR